MEKAVQPVHSVWDSPEGDTCNRAGHNAEIGPWDCGPAGTTRPSGQHRRQLPQSASPALFWIMQRTHGQFKNALLLLQ